MPKISSPKCGEFKDYFVDFGLSTSGFANFIEEWSHCDFCFSNFGVILEY